jgi:PKD repeat protein
VLALAASMLLARAVVAHPGPCTVSPANVAGAAWTAGDGTILCDGTYSLDSFTVPAGATVYTLDGSTIVIQATSTIQITGTLNADGAGSQGGQVSGSYGNSGLNGGGSGGGTGGRGGSSLYAGGQGGGGGGFGGNGGTGGQGSNEGGNPAGGGVYDTGNSVSLPQTTGSGGGGGGTGGNVFSFDNAGVGGNGGGSLALLAPHIIIDGGGVVSANGAGGAQGDAGGSGGGGSGGDILLEAAQGITNNGTVAVNGGTGGNGSGGSLNQGGGGGGGGGGRIKTHTSWFCTGGSLSVAGAGGGSDSSGTFGDSGSGSGGASGSSSCDLDSGYFLSAYSGSTHLSPSGSPNPVGATSTTTISANPTNPGQYALQYQYDCTGTGSSYSAPTTAASYGCSWNTIGAHTVLVRATAYNALAFPDGTPAGTQFAFYVPAASTTITVHDVPVVSVSGPGSGRIGTTVTPFIGSFSDVAANTAPATWTWTYGDGNSTSVNSTLTSNTQSHVYSEPATYTVGLTVTDNYGTSARDTTTVSIADVAPTVTIGTLPPPQNATLSATFTASAVGIAPSVNAAGFSYSFAWGDGSSSPVAATGGNGSGVSASHTYATPGSYTLTVSATDRYGLTGSASKVVTVINPVPSVQISAANSVPIQAAFQPSVTANNGYATTFTFVFNWGDGQMASTQTGSSPQAFMHTYSVPGSYTVQATATDTTGATNSATQTIAVTDVGPTVVIAAPSPSPVASMSSTFLASASSITPAITNAGYTFAFSWGDGTPLQGVSSLPLSDSASPTHIYANPNVYTLTVSATDEYGGTGTATTTVNVADIPPTASFLAPSFSGSAASPVSVSVQASTPSMSAANGGFTCTLSWGDGQNSTVMTLPGVTTPPSMLYAATATPSHTYDAPGMYTVSLTVTDSLGTASTPVTATVTVADVAPTITNFMHPNGNLAVPTPFSVDVSDVSMAVTKAGFMITWDFGDGMTQSGLNLTSVSHQYAPASYTGPLTYTVKVTAMDTNGMSTTAMGTTTIRDVAPSVSLGPTQTVARNASVTLTPTIAPLDASWTYKYSWTLPSGGSAGTSSTMPTVSDTFQTVGTRTISVTVTDPYGGMGSASVIVNVIDEPPVASDVVVTPAHPLAQQSLTLSYTYTDAESIPESGTTIRWFLNGSGQVTFNDQKTIQPPLTPRNQSWYAVVTPRDGVQFGVPVTSNTVVVTVPPPQVSNVTISPAAPKHADSLQLSYTYSGVYPEVGSTIVWTRNGAPQPLLVGARTVPAPLTKGDTWVATVTPSDGTEAGTPASATVVVQDTAPVLNALSSITKPATGMTTPVPWTVSASDVDGDALTYDCSIPAMDLGAGPAYNVAFPLGTTVVTCTVTDGTLMATGSFSVTINDVGPTLTLTPAQTVDPGQVIVSATAQDPLNRTVTYDWSVSSMPAGAVIQNPGATSAKTFSFTAFTTGEYVLQCIVSNGTLQSTGMTTVMVSRLAPMVNLGGGPRLMLAGETVVLDASHSVAPNGGTLSYKWNVVSGSGFLSSTTDPVTQFTATTGGQAQVSLTADDGTLSTTQSLTIDVWGLTALAAPIASAGQAQIVAAGSTVTLDGSASFDPNAQPLTYAWALQSGPTVTLSNASAVNPTFVAPSAGTFTFVLTVSDSAGSSQSSVTITVAESASDKAPIAAIGPSEVTIEPGVTTVLDGSMSSSPTQHPLSWQWTWVGGPYVDLSGVTQPRCSIIAYGEGEAVLQLVVSDGVLSSAPAFAHVHIAKGAISTPAAAATGPATATTGTPVALDGSGSSDPNGLPLVYQWQQVSGPPAAIHDAETPHASFVPKTAGAYVFQLNISDWFFTASTQVTVNVDAGNIPTAVANGPASGFTGALVTLNGSASHDPLELPLTYSWKQLSGPAVKLSQGDTVTPSFEPSVSGTYEFQLTVSDGAATSAPAMVKVAIAAGGGGCTSAGVDGWFALLVVAACLVRLRRRPAGHEESSA